MNNNLPDLDDLAADMALRQDDLLADLESIVCCESPSNDLAAVRRCADLIASLAERRGCGPATVQHTVGRPVLRIGPQDAPVLILGHLDTVHPLGALARNPWRIQDNRAHGPGVFDMKSGIIIGLHAMAARCATGLSSFLITSDEELGSPSSRNLIEDAATAATAVLVAEPSQHGALKTARKGVSNYVLHFRGRAAHAGLEPELGANACIALAEIALRVCGLGDNVRGTTVTPTVASAGTAANAVPKTAQLHIDARAVTAAEQARIDTQLRRLTTSVAGVSIDVTGGPNRPPLEESASAKLFSLARAVAHQIGVPQPTGTAVGGGSDGNFTAALGIPTLDGLGAVGAGAHTSEEWVEIASLSERTALLAAMINQLGIMPPAPSRSAHIAAGPGR
jgi:glutamate carboxypeptidase